MARLSLRGQSLRASSFFGRGSTSTREAISSREEAETETTKSVVVGTVVVKPGRKKKKKARTELLLVVVALLVLSLMLVVNHWFIVNESKQQERAFEHKYPGHEIAVFLDPAISGQAPPVDRNNNATNRRSRSDASVVAVVVPKELPDALQLDPSSVVIRNKHQRGGSVESGNCCILPGRRKRRKVKAPGCRGVCFTPEACDPEGIYPFRNRDEKNFFRRYEEEIRCTNYTHEKATALYTPANRWNTTDVFPFVNGGVDNENKNENETHKTIPEPRCSKIFQNLFVVPAAKLAFCGIPKVGITNWLQFLRFVMGAHDYPSFPHAKHDLQLWSFEKLQPSVQETIWNDPSWTFAAFLRNPAERLLSAYLDKLKVEKKNGMIAKKLGLDEAFTFGSFVESLSSDLPNKLDCKDSSLRPSLTGLSWCTDEHWRPQVWSCGMSEKIDRFDFIGSLDSAQEHSRALLEKVGLWESHGKHYRNGRSERTASWKDQCVQLFPLQDEFDRNKNISSLSSASSEPRVVGFQQRPRAAEGTTKHKSSSNNTASGPRTLSWDVIGHAKASSSKMDKYYTPELHRRVVDDLYRADYEVWKLLDNENGDWVSGRDILPQLLRNTAIANDAQQQQQQ